MCGLLSVAVLAHAQERPALAAGQAWFGVTVPPAAGASPAVRIGTRAPRSVSLPPGETPSPDFDGAAMKADVATIVGFSTEARVGREVGTGQMWGRIAGFPSNDRTVAWAVQQFRKAGITDVRTQPFGNSGLTRDFPSIREQLAPGIVAGDVKVENARLDEILIAMLKGE